MCRRITLTRPNFESISTELTVQPMNYRGMPIYKPRYNAASTDILPILTLEKWRASYLRAAVIAGNHIFRIGREAVLVQFEPFDFALGGHTQSEGLLDAVHESHRYYEGRYSN